MPKYWCKKREEYVDEETFKSEDCMGTADPKGRCPQLVVEDDTGGVVKNIPVRYAVRRIIDDT